MLVFDEKEHYSKLMQHGFEKYPNKRDLVILCREWAASGLEANVLKENLVDFCVKFNPQFNYAKMETVILKVVNQVMQELKKPPIFNFNKNIVLYTKEVNDILAINNKNLQKLAFILTCLAKWRNANYVYLNSLSSIKLREVFQFAKIKATAKEQYQYLHELNSIGFLDVQLKPLLKFFIKSIVNDGQKKLQFKISSNMIDNWLEITCPKCERCGAPFERITNNQKYCRLCAKKIKSERELDRIRRKKDQLLEQKVMNL